MEILDKRFEIGYSCSKPFFINHSKEIVVAKKPALPVAGRKAVLEQLIAAFVIAASTENGGVIYCSSGVGFRLDELTKKEESRFRKALKEADNLSVISIPIGKKRSRYKDLFRSGRVIHPIVGKGGRDILYVPPGIFQRVWCCGGTVPDYVTIIA